MPDPTREELAQAIHSRGVRLVLAVAGGGSRAISSLLTVPGASRSILAAAVPYASAALVEWLGGTPDEFCSASTARAMAMSAYLRARQYDPAASTCGVACTASLASDRAKRGPHRAHLAWQTPSTTAIASVELVKGRRTRSEEEDVVCDLLLNEIADACGADVRLAMRLPGDEPVETSHVVAPDDVQALLAGTKRMVPRGSMDARSEPGAIFPGAFHPLHHGHRQMACLARELLGCEVAYELSIANVDKPPLDFIEIEERASQFAAGEPLWLTRAPLYVQKADLFPGSTFIVGADTIARIGQPRYYGDDEALEQAIAEVASRGCRFLVFGREFEGAFRTIDNLGLPATLRSLCRQVPAQQFRDAVSSTTLRQGAKT